MFIFYGLTLTFFLWCIKDYLHGRKRPPGPPRFPFVGNMVQIMRCDAVFSHLAFHKLSQKFGGIMRLKVGFQNVVVISDFEIMKDIMSKEEFSGRHFGGYMLARSFYKPLGIIFTSGDVWKDVRRFTVRTLREFGFGKKETMESAINKELRNFVQHFRNTVMNRGIKFDYTNQKLLNLLKINEEVLQSGNFGANASFAFPFLPFIMPNRTGFTTQLRVNATFQAFVREIFKDHRQRKEFLLEPESFIDICLDEIDKNSKDPNTSFTEEQFIITIIDLFQVGSETTGNTLSYAILFLMLHPEVQEKMYSEIVSVFPDPQNLDFQDRKRLPYVEATIFEVLRLANVVPIPPPRKAMCKTTYKDYTFSKDAIVMMNFYSILMDENIWGKDAHKFRPERFLEQHPSTMKQGTRIESREGGENGLRERVENVFGFGKRVCVGANLAQVEIFFYLTTLVRNFSFHKAPGEKDPSSIPLPGFVLSPQAFNVMVRCRE